MSSSKTEPSFSRGDFNPVDPRVTQSRRKPGPTLPLTSCREVDPGFRRDCEFLLYPESVEPRRGADEQVGFFRFRGARCQPLERIEQHRIAACALIDREIALEHAAVRAKRLDAGLNIGTPRL